MKIGEALNNSSNIVGASGKEDRKVSDGKESSFMGRLQRIEGDNYQERLNVLANKITEQGEKLGKKIDIRELKVYKQLMSEFLEEAVNNSLKFSKDSHLDRRGRYRVYAAVKKINEELDGLTQDVLKQEKDHISILKRLDDIRGLVMDVAL